MKHLFLYLLAFHSSLLAGNLKVTGETAQIQGPTGRQQLSWDSGLLRFWHSAESVPVWTFTANRAGSVEISINQANSEAAGTACVVSFGESSHTMSVLDTKSWRNFQKVKVGTFHFKKGINQLKIDPKDLTQRAVMDLKNVVLEGDTELLNLITPHSFKRMGVRQKLNALHPSMKVDDLTPEGLTFKVNGMGFLSDGTLVVATWDKFGSVYLITGHDGPRKDMQITRFAEGLAEPLGLYVVDDVIYVQQKQELTRLRDLDSDGSCDSYEVVSNAWEVSANFHEFSFGPIFNEGYFYVALAIAVENGGATTNPQQKDRGTFIKIDPETGQYEVLAAGLRTPNGVGISPDAKTFYIADNQGDYLPANKIIAVKEGRFYGHRYHPAHPWSSKDVSPPMVWLPHNEIANSPTEPVFFTKGIYAGQMICGDIFHGGLRRISIETINGEQQGTAFRFSQGLRGGTNRLEWGPRGNLYVGISGSKSNWGSGQRDGLQRVSFSDEPVFEILSVKTKTNGLELTFTEPLAENVGWDPAFYRLDSYTYKPTASYGGPKIDRHELTVHSATVSKNRKRVFLEIPNIKTGYIVHGILDPDVRNSDSDLAWAAEWWTTVNQIPSNSGGTIRPAPSTAARSRANLNLEATNPHKNALIIHAESCQSCHNLTSERLIGPGFAGLLGKQQWVIKNGKKVKVTVDSDYLRRAILKPNVEHPVGYQPIMPPLGAALTKKQVDDLVEWISSLKN